MKIELTDAELDLIGELLNGASIGRFGPLWLRLQQQITLNNQAAMRENEQAIQKRIDEAVSAAGAIGE